MSAASTRDFKAMSGKTVVWNFLSSRKKASGILILSLIAAALSWLLM